MEPKKAKVNREIWLMISLLFFILIVIFMLFTTRFTSTLKVDIGISMLFTTGFTDTVKIENTPQPQVDKEEIDPQVDKEGIVLSPEIPNDLPSEADQQAIFDKFSWQSFVALNWPADENGKPLNPKEESTFGSYPEVPRIWQCYERPEEVFQQHREKPLSSSKGKCQKTMLLSLPTAKEQLDSVEEFNISEEVHFPLIDQQKNYVLIEMRVNPDEARQIRDNNWDKVETLKQYEILDNCGNEGCKLLQFSTNQTDAGPIELKVAWRIFDSRNSSEEKARYYTMKQKLHIPAYLSSTGNEIDQEVEVGLIGFHIAHKTKNKKWIWSTFEHINNLKVDTPSIPPGLKPTLRNPDCNDIDKCPPNERDKKESYLWRKETPHAVMIKDGGELQELDPTQVERLKRTGLFRTTREQNEHWRKKFKELNNSVWQYYQLIGTEWVSLLPCGLGSEQPERCGNYEVKQLFNNPIHFSPGLVNVAIEPYVKPEEASCIKCHARARLTQDRTRSADFSFLFERFAK